MLDEGLLDGVERIAAHQSLDGGDRSSLALDRQHETTVDWLGLKKDRAGAAVAHVAAGLGAGQADLVAERVQQGLAWLQIEVVGNIIDRQMNPLSRRVVCSGCGRGWHPIRHDTLAFLGDDPFLATTM